MTEAALDTLTIRPAEKRDEDAVWAIIGPILAAGEAYGLPRDWNRDEAIAYWYGGDHEAWVAEDDGRVVGTYFMRPNQMGGGSHVANCGYATDAAATGRGIAAGMCAHSLAHARKVGFRAMQFNFVISTNIRAVALWQRMGFAIVGRLPGAFLHPGKGYVDALVMFQDLEKPA